MIEFGPEAGRTQFSMSGSDMMEGSRRPTIRYGVLALFCLAGIYFVATSETVDAFQFECENVGEFDAELPLQILVWVPKGTKTKIYLANAELNDSTFYGQTVQGRMSYKFAIGRDDAKLTDVVGGRSFHHQCRPM